MTIDISGTQGAWHGEVSMAAAASIPASLVRLPLWYACSNPRLIVAFAFSVARDWRLGAEGESARVGNRCKGLSEGHAEIVRQNASYVERNV